MFSSTRLHAFVCLALGVAVIAAPAGAPAADVQARSPDVYDLSGNGGLVSAGGYYYDPQTGNFYPYYPYGYGQGGNSGEDVYILKRQPAGLDVGSELGANMGIEHASEIGEGALALAANVDADASVEKRAPDVYDLSGDGGLAAYAAYYGYPYGNQYGGYGGDSDEDVYVLKREGDNVAARSPDTYDLSGDGGFPYGYFGNPGYPYGIPNGEEGDEDSDTYILKRQIPGLDLASGLGASAGLGSTGLNGLSSFTSGSSSGMTTESTSTSTDASSDGSSTPSFGADSGLDIDSLLLSNFGGSLGAGGNAASGLSL